MIFVSLLVPKNSASYQTSQTSRVNSFIAKTALFLVTILFSSFLIRSLGRVFFNASIILVTSFLATKLFWFTKFLAHFSIRQKDNIGRNNSTKCICRAVTSLKRTVAPRYLRPSKFCFRNFSPRNCRQLLLTLTTLWYFGIVRRNCSSRSRHMVSWVVAKFYRSWTFKRKRERFGPTITLSLV